MASFDFMTDEDLRASLEDDVRQMNVCLDAGAYKAAQVLAGSIVEALLTDFLTGIAYKPKAKSILEMTLGELVVAARSEKVVSAMTSELASVVKEYRNLIHPGRAKRLAQTADAHARGIEILGAWHRPRRSDITYVIGSDDRDARRAQVS